MARLEHIDLFIQLFRLLRAAAGEEYVKQAQNVLSRFQECGFNRNLT